MYYTFNKSFKKEQIVFKNIPYKSNDEFEKELFNLKNDTHNINPIFNEYKNKHVDPLFQIMPIYKEEFFNKKDYGDIDFYNWLHKQKKTVISCISRNSKRAKNG
jgi:uncharacterized Rmd1/YagE family protein